MRKNPPCSICGNPNKTIFRDGMYLCNKHYLRMWLHGDPHYERKRERTCQYIEDGNLLRIITKKGEEILCDISDKEKLMKYSWCISKTGYPVANINGKVRKLHRYLLDLNDPKIIADHINNNPLDNRRCNIRICTPKQNSMNQSVSKSSKTGVLGVSPTRNGTYRARIAPNGKEIHIGTFKTLEEAIKARNEAELKYFGEYANHINEIPG